MKNFFKRIWNILALFFTNPERWIEQNVLPSIEIVNNIKKFIDSGIAIGITAIIPGTWDDTLRQAFSTHLGTVIDLFCKKGIIESKETLENKLTRLSKLLNNLTPTARAGIYAKLASRLAKQNAGTDAVVKHNAVDLLTQAAYVKLKSSINFDDAIIDDDFQIVEKTIIPKI